MSKPFPGVDVPLVNPQTGLMTQTWTEYFQSSNRQLLAGLSGQPDVKLTSLLNGQVLIWNSTDSKWENGTN